MAYLAYHFTVNPVQPGAEVVMAFIADYPFESFENTDTGFVAYIQEVSAKDLSFDFDLPDVAFSYRVEPIKTVNWNETWENNFEPVKIDGLLNIRAPFHAPDVSTKHEIVIMPKMSFGTGHHQTTRLVCKHMFNTDFKHKMVLDMGCGTGILAILARQLGAATVTGIDIDAWSVENAIENCQTNHCSDIHIYQGDEKSLLHEKTYDVILANINKNILKRQLPLYSGKLKPGGYLFLSGFFTTDVLELTAVAEANGFSFGLSDQENEWAMIVLIKN
jgi:ribosomal protein L11 methyltransferase